jgi:hypothetical protein
LLSSNSKAQRMYIVRVNHKNGLYLEFLFLDMGKAQECAETCAKAKLDQAACHVFDEAGRETWLDGREMAVVQWTPLEDEVKMNTRMRTLAEMIADDWLISMGVKQKQQAAPEPVPNGRVVPREPVEPAMASGGRFSA